MALEEDVPILLSKSFREDGPSVVTMMEIITGEGGSRHSPTTAWLIPIARSIPAEHMLPSNLERTVAAIHQEVQLIRRDVQITKKYVQLTRAHQHDQATAIFNFPILAVISEPDSQGLLLGRAKRLFGRVYRVHFLCAVCGCCAPSGQKGNGKGYALPFQEKVLRDRLELFKKTLLIADVLLQLHSVPFKPSVLVVL